MNQLIILYVVSMLMDMSVAGLMFAISRRAAELGASAGALGLLGAMWLLPYSILSLVSGRLSDRFGRRRVALIGPLVTSLAALACAFTTNIQLLLGLNLVFGVGLGFYWPSIIAWLSEDVSGPRLHARLTIFGVAWNVGLLIGFGLTGLVFRHWPPLAFYIPAAAMGLIFVLLLVPAKMPVPAAPATGSVTPAVPSGQGFRKTAWLSNFGLQLATGGVTALFPQLATSLGIHADIHGGLLAMGRGAAIVMFLVLECLMFWRTRLWPLWLAQCVCAGGILIVGATSQVALFVAGFVIMGAVSGYGYQASIYFTLDEMAEKGKGSGVHEAVLASGMMTGPLLAGWVGNHTGLRMPYYFCAALLALLVAIQWTVVLVRRRQPSPAPAVTA